MSLIKGKGKKKKGSGANMTTDSIGRVVTIRQRKAILKLARLSFFKKVFVIAAIITVLLTLVFGITSVEGEDMAPALRDGDIVLYFRLGGDYNNSDVLVFRHEDKQYISRVVAINGTSLDKSEKGLVLFNGRIHPPQPKNGLFYDTEGRNKIKYPLTVGPDEYFVMGDRRDVAQDSRDFGPIKKSDVKGKVFTVIRKNSI